MSTVLIITGMHRSGTSLVAGLIDQAGVNLGPQRIAPAADNPHGYFEDAEIVRFHQDLLHARGENILVTREFALMPTAAERAHAQELIAARAGLPVWGWKDPRACLLLDFWNEVVPGARFLLLYRHPFDVVLSLARRIEVVGFDFYTGLEAWYAYNARLLEFARRHPNTTLLCSSYTLLARIEEFSDLLRARLGLALELTPALRDGSYQQDQLHRLAHPPEANDLLHQIHPEALDLYDALQLHAAMNEQGPPQRISAELEALCRYAAQVPTPLDPARRRALLAMLVALYDPDLYDRFANESVRRTAELEAQRRAWRKTAEDRAQLLREQTEWAQPRLAYLTELESSAIVRALVRLGILPKP
jgi:hypothetical protein